MYLNGKMEFFCLRMINTLLLGNSIQRQIFEGQQFYAFLKCPNCNLKAMQNQKVPL